MTRTLHAVTIAAVSGLLLAGCTSTPADQATSPATSTSSSTTASPSPTTTSPEDLAAGQAEEVLRSYYRVWSSCTLDPPNTPITCFDQVAITTELTNRRNALASAQAMQTRTTGDITPLSIKRISVDLTNKVNETPPVVPQVVFRVCEDVSQFNIVDKDGKSIVPANRQPHAFSEVHVANYEYPDPAQWRVAFVVPVKGQTC